MVPRRDVIILMVVTFVVGAEAMLAVCLTFGHAFP